MSLFSVKTQPNQKRNYTMEIGLVLSEETCLMLASLTPEEHTGRTCRPVSLQHRATGFWPVECGLLQGLARKHPADCPHYICFFCSCGGHMFKMAASQVRRGRFPSHLLEKSFSGQYPTYSKQLQEQGLSMDFVKPLRCEGCSLGS